MEKNLKKVNNLVSLFLHLLNRANHYVRRIQNGELGFDTFSKGDNDYFTTADFVIQKMFEVHLEKYYPNIKIIGEEDTKAETIKESEYFTVDTFEKINFDLIKENLFNEETQNINIEDLHFYIDPIDSTSSFIKRNFKPCTVMIGLTLNKEPFLGILHYFCWEGRADSTKTIFNIPIKGVFEYDLDSNKLDKFEFKKNENELNIVTSKYRTSEGIEKSFEFFDDKKIFYSSGFGNKGYQLMKLDGLFISSCKYFPLWDTCASNCLVNELGGGFYYFDGSKVKYDIENTSNCLSDYFIICASQEKKEKFFEVYNKNKSYFDEHLE